jgi:glutamate--cysteine ligase
MSSKIPSGRIKGLIDESLQPLIIHGLKGIEKEGLRMTRKVDP